MSTLGKFQDKIIMAIVDYLHKKIIVLKVGSEQLSVFLFLKKGKDLFLKSQASVDIRLGDVKENFSKLIEALPKNLKKEIFKIPCVVILPKHLSYETILTIPRVSFLKQRKITHSHIQHFLGKQLDAMTVRYSILSKEETSLYALICVQKNDSIKEFRDQLSGLKINVKALWSPLMCFLNYKNAGVGQTSTALQEMDDKSLPGYFESIGAARLYFKLTRIKVPATLPGSRSLGSTLKRNKYKRAILLCSFLFVIIFLIQFSRKKLCPQTSTTLDFQQSIASDEDALGIEALKENEARMSLLKEIGKLKSHNLFWVQFLAQLDQLFFEFGNVWVDRLQLVEDSFKQPAADKLQASFAYEDQQEEEVPNTGKNIASIKIQGSMFFENEKELALVRLRELMEKLGKLESVQSVRDFSMNVENEYIIRFEITLDRFLEASNKMKIEDECFFSELEFMESNSFNSSVAVVFEFQTILHEFQAKTKSLGIHNSITFNEDCKVIGNILSQQNPEKAIERLSALKALLSVIAQSEPLGVNSLKLFNDRDEIGSAFKANETSLYKEVCNVEVGVWGSVEVFKQFLNTLVSERFPFVLKKVSVAPYDTQDANHNPSQEAYTVLAHARPSLFLLELQVVRLNSLYLKDLQEDAVLSQKPPITWCTENRELDAFELFSPSDILFNLKTKAVMLRPSGLEDDIEWIDTKNILFPYQLMGWFRSEAQGMPLLFIYAKDSKETFLLKPGDELPGSDVVIKAFEEKPIPRAVTYSKSLRKEFILEEGSVPVQEVCFVLKHFKNPEQLLMLSPANASVEINNSRYTLMAYDLENEKLTLSKKNLKNAREIVLPLNLSKNNKIYEN